MKRGGAMSAVRKRSKSVSWAPDVNLRQVWLFLSEDAPAHVGLATQDLLQAKSSWLWHSNNLGPDSSLPPGFESNHSPQPLKQQVPQIALIKWVCPYQLILNSEWLVTAGEESEEVNFQNQRQRGVLEAIYPRQSSIPSNPSSPHIPEDFQFNDAETPLVPITAIEEEDIDPSCASSSDDDSSTNGMSYSTTNLTSPVLPPILPSRMRVPIQPCSDADTASIAGGKPDFSGFIPRVEPDVLAAASVAFTAIMKSSDEGSMVDPELLIEILRDPKMVEKLVTECGASKQATVLQPALAMMPPTPAQPAGPPQPTINTPQTSLLVVPSPQSAPCLNPPPWSAHVKPQKINTPIPASIPPKDVNAFLHPSEAAKDLTYCKNLIQQHGGDNLGPPDWNPRQCVGPDEYPLWNNEIMGNNNGKGGVHEYKKREVHKPRIAKPCVYFNTQRGCKRGACCLYQHDLLSHSQQVEGRGRKRSLFDK